MKIRQTKGGTPVTWAFKSSVLEERNQCLDCSYKDGNLCPRHRLTKDQKKKMVATRCIFRNLEQQ
jgi:hypothetical protein